MAELAAVEEVPVCTPDLLEGLAIGWLHGEGYAAIQAEGRKPVLASGCGAVSTFLADPATVQAQPPRGPVPELDQLRALFKALFATGERYKDTGGTPSVPSTLAVEIARRSGMVLIGRAVSGHSQHHGAVSSGAA